MQQEYLESQTPSIGDWQQTVHATRPPIQQHGHRVTNNKQLVKRLISQAFDQLPF